MTMTVPSTVIDLVTKFAVTSDDKEQIVGAVYTPEIATAFRKLIDRRPDILTFLTEATNNPQGNKPSHPNAPVRKGSKVKAPYWIKQVSSVNLAQPNGFGIKGSFMTPEAIEKHGKQGDIYVVCKTDYINKSKEYEIYHYLPNATSTTTLAAGMQLTLNNVTRLFNSTNCQDIFRELTSRHGIQTTTSTT